MLNVDIVPCLQDNYSFVIHDIKTDKGHDSFLVNEPEFLETLKGFLDSNFEIFKNEK